MPKGRSDSPYHKRGPDNPMWTGGDGHAAARHLYPGPLVCEWPGCTAIAERHHKDGDPKNNDRSNIEFLCKPHHIERERRFSKPQSRANLSAALKGRQLSQAHRASLSAAARGKPKSAAHRDALSAALRGRPNPAVKEARSGKPLSVEHRRRISDGLKGRPCTDEARAKISAANRKAWQRRKAKGTKG